MESELEFLERMKKRDFGLWMEDVLEERLKLLKDNEVKG